MAETHAELRIRELTSALKRCEEERDDAIHDEMEARERSAKRLERAESAEAKCEWLEAIAREFKGRFHGNGETTTAADSRQLVRRWGGEHNEVEFNLAQIEHKIDALLSTPKTEGELYGLKVHADDRLEPGQWLLGADPIGRDVRGYEK